MDRPDFGGFALATNHFRDDVTPHDAAIVSARSRLHLKLGEQYIPSAGAKLIIAVPVSHFTMSSKIAPRWMIASIRGSGKRGRG